MPAAAHGELRGGLALSDNCRLRVAPRGVEAPRDEACRAERNGRADAVIFETPGVALVAAAHADDEVLGCGATISRLTRSGWSVHVLLMSDGCNSRDDETLAAMYGTDRRGVGDARIAAAHRVGDILGYESVRVHGFPDNAFDSISVLEFARIINDEIARVRPEIVLTHSHADLNQDHRAVAHAAAVSTRPTAGSPVRAVLAFEVRSSTEWGGHRGGRDAFHPVLGVAIDDVDWERKERALGEYAPEMRPPPDARSLEAVDLAARLRGADFGVTRAEVFEVMQLRA
jgi:LmbE family N-acetylglucosaminyl deacetylase